MPRINLLPWREERRERRQKQFKNSVAGIVILAVLVVGYWYHLVNKDIAYQRRRNDFLQEQISRLDKRIDKISDLKKQRKRLKARMRIIERLQQSRPQIVHIFDQLVRTLPDGIYLTRVNQNGNSLHIEGIARSSARISTYMRNISESKWLADPSLRVIKAQKEDGHHRKAFTMNATITSPSQSKKSQDQTS